MIEAKIIPGYEFYYIDVQGNVYSTKQNRLKQMTPCVHQSGYMVVTLDNKVQKVHRLLATTFLNLDPTSCLVVNHKDFNKLNNDLNNLEIITHQQNAVHARLGGRFVKKFGEENPMSKLDNNTVLMLRRMAILGLHDKEIGNILNIRPASVGRIRMRRRWAHI